MKRPKIKISDKQKKGALAVGVIAAGYFVVTSMLGGGEDEGWGSAGGGGAPAGGVTPLGLEEIFMAPTAAEKVRQLPPPQQFPGFEDPFAHADTYKPNIEEYEHWMNIDPERALPPPTKKEVPKAIVTFEPHDPKPPGLPAKILDTVMALGDPTMPYAREAAAWTHETYIPLKKESLEEAKLIPVHNLTTKLQDIVLKEKGGKFERYDKISGTWVDEPAPASPVGGIFGMFAGMGSPPPKKEAAKPKTSGGLVAFGPKSTAGQMLDILKGKSADTNVKFYGKGPVKADKVDYADLINVAGWTAVKKKQTTGAPYKAQKVSFSDLKNVSGWTSVKQQQTTGAPYKAKKTSYADLHNVAGWSAPSQKKSYSSAPTTKKVSNLKSGYSKSGGGYSYSYKNK